MRMLLLQTSRVKAFANQPLIRMKRSLILAAISLGALVLLYMASGFISQRTSAHSLNSTTPEQQACCTPPSTSRRMTATYYTTEDSFKSTLTLNNKGPHQIVVTPILHAQNGQTYTAPPVAVGGQSSSKVDLNAIAASAGPQFKSGSVEFTYTGRLLEVGGGLTIVDAGKSLIFDEQALEPGMKFSSPQLESVFPIPFESTQVTVILTNTTPNALAVEGQATFSDLAVTVPIPFVLGPYQSRTFPLPQNLIRQVKAGAVSLKHNGEKGALLAMIHTQDSEKGFSQAINFSDPSHSKTNQLHGAGLRLGSVNNDELNLVIAVRNVSAGATSLNVRVPYSKQNGSTGTISLPQLSLAPGEIKLVDTSNSQLRQNDFSTAGLEIEYTGTPGSIVVSAASISRSGNHVFVLPVKDPKVGISSTGGYPWLINGSSSTVVFIKNTTREQQKFVLDLVYPGGRWGSGFRILAPGQTFKLDVREIRDSQIKGSEGNTVPLNAVAGHVSWTVHGKDASMTLIGRAQTVDLPAGLVSTYECQQCCQGSWIGRIDPGSVSGYPGDQTQFRAQEAWQDCYGTIGSFCQSSAQINWSSQDPNVASCDSNGLATARNPGSTSIIGAWTTYRSVLGAESLCSNEAVDTAASAACQVQTPCAFPVNFRQISAQDIGGGLLRFIYKWDSNTGKLEDLANCIIYETVNYPGSGTFVWPSPPYSSGEFSRNPDVNGVPGEDGEARDTHRRAAGWQEPYEYNQFTATQTYHYECPCKNGGSPVNLAGPMEIVRTVQLTPYVDWTYTVTKSGARAILQPLR